MAAGVTEELGYLDAKQNTVSATAEKHESLTCQVGDWRLGRLPRRRPSHGASENSSRWEEGGGVSRGRCGDSEWSLERCACVGIGLCCGAPMVGINEQ